MRGVVIVCGEPGPVGESGPAGQPSKPFGSGVRAIRALRHYEGAMSYEDYEEAWYGLPWWYRLWSTLYYRFVPFKPPLSASEKECE